MTELPEGMAVALHALEEANEQGPRSSHRLTPQTLRSVVEVAWRNQFETSSRARARQQLRDALAGEFARAKAATDAD